MLGILCAVIAIDDTMLLHEEVLPSFGVAEELLLAAYALAGLVLALRFWPLWPHRGRGRVLQRRSDACHVLAVHAFLAMLIIEDVAKLIDVLAWCFCGAWAHSERSAVTSPSPSAQRN